MRSYGKLIAVATAAIALALGACGGGGGCVDVYPTPEFDFFDYRSLDSADLNGDGLADLAIASELIYGSDPQYRQCGGTVVDGSDGNVTVLLQDINSPGSFASPQVFRLRRPSVDGLKLADLNADAIPDFIVAHRWGDKIFDVALNDPANPGSLLLESTYTTTLEPNQISTGDIDRDGDIDIMIAGSNSVVWHPQSGTGSFATRQEIGPTEYSGVLADFDEDGWLDVAVSVDSDSGNDVLVYRQTAMQPGTFEQTTRVPLNLAIWILGVGDLDDDNKSDIVAAGFDVDRDLDFHDLWYRVLQISSDPLRFAAREPRLSGASNFTAIPVVSDLDGDGRNDVVLGAESQITLYLQDPAPGEFSRRTVYGLPAPSLLCCSAVNAIAVADLNNDTLPDIAVSNGEVLVLFQNPGAPGTFDEPVLILQTEPL